MKKKKFLVLAICAMLMAAGILCEVKMPVYAYTDEKIEQAKDWLSANGYPPTRAGAEQAYQDYLNGLIDPFGTGGGQEEQPTETQQETVTEEVAETAETVGAEMVEQPKESTETAEKATVESSEAETVMEMVEEDTTETETKAEIETVTEVVETSSEEQVESAGSVSEETSEIESEAAEEGGAFISVGQYDIWIVVGCVVACAVMIYFVVRYIKKKE